MCIVAPEVAQFEKAIATLQVRVTACLSSPVNGGPGRRRVDGQWHAACPAAVSLQIMEPWHSLIASFSQKQGLA